MPATLLISQINSLCYGNRRDNQNTLPLNRQGTSDDFSPKYTDSCTAIITLMSICKYPLCLNRNFKEKSQVLESNDKKS